MSNQNLVGFVAHGIGCFAIECQSASIVDGQLLFVGPAMDEDTGSILGAAQSLDGGSDSRVCGSRANRETSFWCSGAGTSFLERAFDTNIVDVIGRKSEEPWDETQKGESRKE